LADSPCFYLLFFPFCFPDWLCLFLGGKKYISLFAKSIQSIKGKRVPRNHSETHHFILRKLRLRNHSFGITVIYWNVSSRIPGHLSPMSVFFLLNHCNEIVGQINLENDS
jgi:hypothetical protein